MSEGVTLRTAEIAAACNAWLNHLLQVVNALHARGLVTTIRGRSGGVRLARPPAQVSMGEVFRVFESGTPFAECFYPETNTCPLSATCRLRSYVARAVEEFYHEKDMVTLADLVKGNCGLVGLLEVRDGLRRKCPEAETA